VEMQVRDSFAFRVNAVPVAMPRQRSSAYIDKEGSARARTPYTSAKHPVNIFKAGVADKSAQHMEERPLITSPVYVGLTIVLPRPKSLTREWRSTGRIPMIKIKGDLDNFLKAVYDAMQSIVYDNDSRIYASYAEAYFAAENESPHALILVQTHDLIPSEDEVPADGRKRARKEDSPVDTEANR